MSGKPYPVRRSALAFAAVGLAIGGLATPAFAQQDIEEYCRTSAHVICGYDSSGQPTWPTFECTQREYDACIEFYGPKEG